jgi:hypothetical protein
LIDTLFETTKITFKIISKTYFVGYGKKKGGKKRKINRYKS